jgi:hypothetical protein
MKFTHSFFVCLAATRAFAAADSALPDFLPAETKAVIGIQVRSIVSSPLAQGITPDLKAAGSDWLKLVSLAGFDPSRDIEEVLIASTGEGQNAPVLAVARGSFDLARFSANAKPYHGVPVSLSGKGSVSVMAMLDASTVILGDLPLVRAAIDRRGSGARLDPALAAAAALLRDRYEIWGLGDRPGVLVPKNAQPDGLDSIDRFQFGISVSHGLELAAEIHAASAKDAEKLTASVRLIEAMLKAQQPSAKLDIRAENGTLKLSLAIPEEELKKAMAAQRASVKPAAAAKTGLTITSEPASAPPPKTDGSTGVLTLPGKR